MIKVIYLAPEDTAPRIMQIESEDITIINKLVGGDFDIMYPDNYGITGTLARYDIYVNDDFLRGGYLPNISLNMEAVIKKDYDRAGIVLGPLLVAGYDDEGCMTAVADADIPEVCEILKRAMLQNKKRK